MSEYTSEIQRLLKEWAKLSEKFVDIDAAWEEVVSTDEYQDGTLGYSCEEDEWDTCYADLTDVENKLYALAVPTYDLNWEDYL